MVYVTVKDDEAMVSADRWAGDGRRSDREMAKNDVRGAVGTVRRDVFKPQEPGSDYVKMRSGRFGKIKILRELREL